MAWIELIIGIVMICVGVMLMLGAANTPAPNSETNRYALYGLVSGVGGALLFILGAIQIIVKLFHVVFG